MATIERTYGADGRVEVEPLYHMLFTLEKGAHTFIITLENGDVLATATDVFARFRRSDGQTVHIVGALSGETATVTLPETCYNAPGPFGLSIFVTNEAINTESGGDVDPMTVCVYACAGQVAPTTTDDVITEETTPSKTMEEMIADVKADIAGAHMMAVWAVNIGEIEETASTYKTTVEDIHDLLTAAGLQKLNEPNLIRQPGLTQTYIPNGEVLEKVITIPAEDATAAAAPLSYTISDEAITANHEIHWGASSDPTNCSWHTKVTATFTAGSAAVTIAERAGAHENAITLTLYLCVRQSVLLPYGEIARCYGPGPWLDSIARGAYPGDEQDTIYERGVILAGDDIVTDLDGAAYNTAVAFYVTAVESGFNNCDRLIWPSGNDRSVIDSLTDGQTYTLSCWARITSGEHARLHFGYGHNSYGYQPYDGGRNYEVIDIDNTAWQRVSWTFVYHATQTYTPDGQGATPITTTNEKRVGVGVCRKYTGTVQLCGFRLTEGGLLGNDTVSTLKAQIVEQNAVIAALTARVEALEGG